jgi:hypothetical protein
VLSVGRLLVAARTYRRQTAGFIYQKASIIHVIEDKKPQFLFLVPQLIVY